MNAANLTDRQHAKLKRELAGRREYLDRLRKRMESRGWYIADPVYCSVVAAFYSLHAAVKAMGVRTA